MKKNILNAVVLLLTLAILLPTIGCASGGGHGRHQGPPPEAIAACEGKSVGDNVSFNGPRGDTIEATCQEKNGQLAAVPDNPPEDGGPRKD